MTDAIKPESGEAVALTVWYGKMPESNGRENWTATLCRKDARGFDTSSGGFCFARSEYPGRVLYEADRVRWIIGERAEKPFILDYDADTHSGYVEALYAHPGRRGEVTAPDTVALVERLKTPVMLKSLADAPNRAIQKAVAERWEAAAAIQAQAARIAELEGGLKPFAAWAVSFDGDAVEYPAPDTVHLSIRHNPSHKTSLTVADLRQARSLLSEVKK